MLRILDYKIEGHSIRLKPWIIALVLVLFGGLDVLAYVVSKTCRIPYTGHIEWWAKYIQYSSNSTLLYWVPQHAIAAWVMTAMATYWYITQRSLAVLGLFPALCIILTPLAILGVIPMGLLLVADAMRKKKVRNLFTFTNCCLAPLLGIAASPVYNVEYVQFPDSFWVGGT